MERGFDDAAGADLDDARDEITYAAERALLGALIVRRETRETVRAWLLPEHFRSWTHAAVYRAVLELEDAGDVPDDDSVAAGRPRAVAERAGAPAATPAYVAALVDACPRADHAAAYARLVVRAALHREVSAEAAELAREAVESEAHDAAALRSLEGRAEDARRTAAAFAQTATLTAEILSDRGRPRDHEPHPTAEETTTARLAGGPSAVPMTEAGLREAGLVAAVARTPALLDEPEVEVLTPQHFTNRVYGALFAAARSLRSRGDVLDELLVVAEADTVALWSAETRPVEAQATLAVAGGLSGAPHLAQQILDHAVREGAVRDAGRLTAAASGERVRSAPELLPAQRAGASRPVVVFVAGDPATTGAAAVLVTDALARRGRAPVSLGRGFPPDHPLYKVVEASGARDVVGRYRAAEGHVLAARLDTVVHARAMDPEALAASMKRFEEAGFRVELAAVPTSAAERRLSVLEVQRARGRAGQLPAPHRDLLPEVLRTVEERALARTVTLLRPNGIALYVNHLVEGPGGDREWVRATAARDVAAAEISRAWTTEESVRFTARYARVAAQADRSVDGALRVIADEADAHQALGGWRTSVALAQQSLAAGPPPRSSAEDRIEAGGLVASLTDRQLDAALVQGFRNLTHAEEAVERAVTRAVRHRELAARGEGEVGERLRAAGADPELSARAAAAAGADAAFYAEHAKRTRIRVEGLRHHIGAILREFNRRSQLTPQQRAHEHSIREGRAQAKIAGTVQRARRRAGRTSHPRAARGAGRPRRTSDAA